MDCCLGERRLGGCGERGCLLGPRLAGTLTHTLAFNMFCNIVMQFTGTVFPTRFSLAEEILVLVGSAGAGRMAPLASTRISARIPCVLALISPVNIHEASGLFGFCFNTEDRMVGIQAAGGGGSSYSSQEAGGGGGSEGTDAWLAGLERALKETRALHGGRLG